MAVVAEAAAAAAAVGGIIRARYDRMNAWRGGGVGLVRMAHACVIATS